MERNIWASLKIQNKQRVHLRQVLLDLSGVIQNCVSIIQTVSKNTVGAMVAKWSWYFTLSDILALNILQKAFQELGSGNGQGV